ncbi:MAG: helix-turn-helix transcriptional regulator [Methanobacteriaceae archaeon]|nr:helix-turn-helix transcriptional regulator [Methanobacteriaceae archaeon]
MLKIILKRLRNNANLTQKQAAELIGITKRSWERYEAGSANINMRNVELFALKTNQNLNNVIKDEEKNNPDFKDFLNN